MIDTVYFYLIGRLVKVGYSRNLRLRAEGLTGDGQYLGAMLGGREIERTFKNEFAAFLSHGEYFHADPAVLATVDRVIGKFGIRGEECVRLTDPETSPRDIVKKRDAEIKRRCIEIIRRKVAEIASTRTLPLTTSLTILADEIGIDYSLAKCLRYSPESNTLTFAEAEAIFAYDAGKEVDAADALDRAADSLDG